MFKIEFDHRGDRARWLGGDFTYRSRREAERGIHELLEEAFGENYGEAEVSLYRVVHAST